MSVCGGMVCVRPCLRIATLALSIYQRTHKRVYTFALMHESAGKRSRFQQFLSMEAS
jgi:hypothetical protein